jgi:hypothetical protein
MKFLNSYNFAILALAGTTNINLSTAQQTTTSQTNQHLRTQISSHNINKQNLDNIQPRQMNRPQKRPTPADGTYSCRTDLYVMGSNSEMTTTVSDDGLTIKNFAPLYGYGLDGRPNYSKPIGQYSSVDILIPVGESGTYTCQQTSFIGTHYDVAWFQDQVTASGICDSSGPGNVWEGSGGVSGGLGMYEGATGSMNWQCWSNCTIALDVCVLDAVQQN